MNEATLAVQMIPINQINVLNPRSRNKVTFQVYLAGDGRTPSDPGGSRS